MACISSGFVGKGFESVRNLFDENLRKGRDEKAQLCVYHQIAVDLWADISDSSSSYDGDSLTAVFSSSKSLAAIAIACLVDRGHLSYNAKVTDYWPEFGQKGKEDVLVCDVLRHESGLAFFDRAMDAADLFPETLKMDNGNAAILMEEQELHFPSEDNKREYHGMTRGTILNEIFRRCDPARRTIGEFFREEISDNGLKADCYVGVRDEAILARIADLKCWGVGYVLLQSMMPSFISQKVDVSLLHFFKLGAIAAKSSKTQRTSDKAPPPFIKEFLANGNGLVGYMESLNLPEVRRAEMPSANFHCSARGMAKVAACIANRGRLGDVQLLKAETIELMMANKTQAQATPYGLITTFSQGGFNEFCVLENQEPDAKKADELRQGFVGWLGAGGSVLQWHPELNIGFGFVSTILRWYDLNNKFGAELQAEVVKCIRNAN